MDKNDIKKNIKNEKRNQNLMTIIKKMHALIEETDVEKTRLSQDHVAKLSITPKDLLIEEISIDGMYGEWIKPDRPHNKRRVILYCHGGGYTSGSANYSRAVTQKLSQATSMDLFSFNYKLAPEAIYPAQLNDAVKAWDYLMLLGYGAKDVILIGDSAGGNLALSLTLKLKETGRILPGAIILYSPWTDMTMSGKSYISKQKLDPVLTREYISTCRARYIIGQDTIPEKSESLPAEDENIASIIEDHEKNSAEYNEYPALDNPLISPLFGDFENFPPVYIQVGTNEILYSDSEALYKKLLSQNVRVQFSPFKGMWHVFQMTPLKTASEAIEKTADFIFNIIR